MSIEVLRAHFDCEGMPSQGAEGSVRGEFGSISRTIVSDAVMAFRL